MDGSPPGSSVHGILQARILKSITMPSSRGSSWTRNWTHVSCIAGGFFTTEPLGKPRCGLKGVQNWVGDTDKPMICLVEATDIRVKSNDNSNNKISCGNMDKHDYNGITAICSRDLSPGSIFKAGRIQKYEKKPRNREVLLYHLIWFLEQNFRHSSGFWVHLLP